jgi:hypothetical protein
VLQWILYWIAGGICIAILFLPWFLWLSLFGGSQRVLVFDPFSYQQSLRFLNILIYSLNINNILPFGLVGILLVDLILGIKYKKEIAISLCILLIIAIEIFSSAILDGFIYSDTIFTAFRYHIVLFPLIAVLFGILFKKVFSFNKIVFSLLFGVFLLSNLFAFTTPTSLIADYIAEISNPYQTPDTAVAEYLNENAKDNDTVILSLERDYEPLIFQLQKKLLFVDRITPAKARFFAKNGNRLPRYVSNFLGEPDWVILYSKLPYDGTYATELPHQIPPQVNLVQDYDEIILPVFFLDMTRPEIHWHSFYEITPAYDEQIFIYHKKSFDKTQDKSS